MGAEVMVTWGTWEELLLGGAVLRHGTRDWSVVAAELRARTLSPCTFTPEVCKAKYEDLQQRYSATWFEEIKKKRVEELKRALELSEDSIGCLESRLESLKAAKNEKRDDCPADNGSAGPDLQVPPLKLERVESSPKETSKDGLSAGSFTHETRAPWSPECQVPAVYPEDQVVETKPEVSRSAEQDKVLDADKLELTIDEGKGVSFKKRRGMRKRKDCARNTSETSVRESDILVSVDVSQCKESSISNCDEVAKSSGIHEENTDLKKDGTRDLMEVLDSILETKGASAFRRRHDSQKRGKYKKMIRQHMDFDTIRSRISGQTIRSAMELFRDLLLLTNNALVFYSKCTREYKTALLLREVVTKKLRESSNSFSSSATHANVSTTLPVDDPPVKVRRVSPGDRKIVAKAADGGSSSSDGTKKLIDRKIGTKAADGGSDGTRRPIDRRIATKAGVAKAADGGSDETKKPIDHKIVAKAADGGSDGTKKPVDRKIVAKAADGGSNGTKKPIDHKIVAKAADGGSDGTKKPVDRKIVAKAADSGSNGTKKPNDVDGAKKPSGVDSPPSVESLPIKKAFGRPRKAGRGAASGRPATPVKGKKRGRAKW